MRVAVALFGEEISPRLDACLALAFAEDGQDLNAAEHHGFDTPDAERRLCALLASGARVLLCGGIRRCDRLFLEMQGLRLIVGLRGSAQEALDAFRDGALDTYQADPPACGCRHLCRHRRKGE